MNIRKPADYTTMFAALDALMAAQLPQMELYCEIGRVVSGRAEKGAAVAASEYLQATYPAADGFSPRNVRRMRAFYATYEESPEIMQQAMRLGWTRNVAILERCGSNKERAWYIRAALHFGWKKAKLLEAIESQAWLHSSLDEQAVSCYTGEKDVTRESECNEKDTLCVSWQYLSQPHGRVRDEGLGEEGRAGVTISYRISGHQPGEDRQPGLSSGATQAGGARDLLQRSRRAVAHQQRLPGIRFYYSAETTVGFGGIFVLSTGLYCNLPAFISPQKSSKQPTLLTVKKYISWPVSRKAVQNIWEMAFSEV